MSNVKKISSEELEKILLACRIKHYEELAEYNYLVDYYIMTGEIPDDYELARENLIKKDCDLTNTDV